MIKLNFARILFLLSGFVFLINFVDAQTALPTPPPPSAPRAVKIPNIQETKLSNNLRIAVIERKNVPLVTATLLFDTGANVEGEKAGLAEMTASILLKGTKTRSATQIAEEIEFLGGNINSGVKWETTTISVNVTSDKIEPALTVMADAVLNPIFSQQELDLLKTQTIDELNVELKQPGILANYVAARYTFGEHNPAGTPESLAKLTRADIVNHYKNIYKPENAVLLFVGDITAGQANALAKKLFGVWKKTPPVRGAVQVVPVATKISPKSEKDTVKKILVIDLPNSGQAAVIYTKKIDEKRVACYEPFKCENGDVYFPALVTNAVLGGGYSARLNMEIRIKRGLSYGAGSSFSWRANETNFTTRGQTKNVSAAEVAELTVKEIEKMETGGIEQSELIPRKLSLTGGFGRELSTNAALTERLIELYSFYLKPEILGAYNDGVNKISEADINKFISAKVKGGNLIIVGDYKIFAEDLKKRFPNQTAEVISASELDLNSETLRK